jgi:hypothetical protein
MELVGVDINDDEMKEGLKLLDELPYFFVLQLDSAINAAYQTCRFNNDSEREYVRSRYAENMEKIDENLICIKSTLKRLKPDHELVKDFEIDPSSNCEYDEKEFFLKEHREYFDSMKITKCSFEEFTKFESKKFQHALDSEVLLMIKILGKPFKEAVDYSISEYVKGCENQLKCLLNQIYDR